MFEFSTGSGISPNWLLLGTDGNLYGTALRGGKQCYRKDTCGTVFELIPPGSSGGTVFEVIP